MWAETKKYKIAGALLTAARQHAGLTQAQLASRIKKPQSFVSSLENGQRRLDVVEFIVLADALKVDPKRLFAQIVADLTK